MRLFYISLMVNLFFSVSCYAHDSTRQKTPRYATALTVRTHTMGFFSYGGRIINQHPSADVFFTYQRANGWGINLFKVVDLKDIHSGNNFLLLLASKKIVLSPRWTTTVYGGAFLEQTHHFASHGSDLTANIITTYKATKHFSLDHMAMMGNLIFDRRQADWVNRFRLLLTTGHWDATVWMWFNNHVFDACAYQSAGLSLYYNRIPLTEKWSVNLGITGIRMIHSTDETAVPPVNGALLTVAAHWH